MEVMVTCRRGVLRLALSGELDDTAAAIVEAAAAVAREEHVELVLDTTGAHPCTSPILDELERLCVASTAPDAS